MIACNKGVGGCMRKSTCLAHHELDSTIVTNITNNMIDIIINIVIGDINVIINVDIDNIDNNNNINVIVLIILVMRKS